MNLDARPDRDGTLALAAGVFVAVVGLGTLLGMPWQHADSTLVAVLQILGALGTVAVGVGLGWLALR